MQQVLHISSGPAYVHCQFEIQVLMVLLYMVIMMRWPTLAECIIWDFFKAACLSGLVTTKTGT